MQDVPDSTSNCAKQIQNSFAHSNNPNDSDHVSVFFTNTELRCHQVCVELRLFLGVTSDIRPSWTESLMTVDGEVAGQTGRSAFKRRISHSCFSVHKEEAASSSTLRLLRP